MPFRAQVGALSDLIADSVIGAFIATALSGKRWVIGEGSNGTILKTNVISGYTGEAVENAPARITVSSAGSAGAVSATLSLEAPALSNGSAAATGIYLTDHQGSPVGTSDVLIQAPAVNVKANGRTVPLEDTGWIEVAGGVGFQNGWVNFDARTARYRRYNGVVYIEGIVKGGTITGNIFQLPAGFRPANRGDKFVVVGSNSAAGMLWIDGTGVVNAYSGSNAWIDLSGIPPFIAEN